MGPNPLHHGPAPFEHAFPAAKRRGINRQVDLRLLSSNEESPYGKLSGYVTLMPTHFEGDFSTNSTAPSGLASGLKDGGDVDQNTIMKLAEWGNTA